MLWRTERTELDEKQIEEYIEQHTEARKELDDLWAYYLGKNPRILKRKPADANTPHNNTPVSYGRKIVNTFVGYAYRPRYITYKSDNEQYLAMLQETFNLNTEHIKTNRNGRNTGVFGESYELVYIDGRAPKPGAAIDNDVRPNAEARFINLDPREVILLYDYSPEPQKVIGIRYYPVSKTKYIVDVYYATKVITYERTRRDQYAAKWVYTQVNEYTNFFGEVPIVAYYMGDERLGIIKPVRALIDDYDTLVSDSIVEFDRFANAYLRLVGMSLSDASQVKRPTNQLSLWLQNLRRYRLFQNLRSPEDVTFLTKDIPKEFIEFMTGMLRDEIHKQAHVPDFMSEKLGGDLSGVAVQRMMFDFENLVSSAEGDFDLGLIERIRLITKVYELGRRGVAGGADDVTISHKRNVPLNVKEFAETSEIMSRAGFSRYLTADIWPDDVIPDVEEELARQDGDRESMFPDIEAMGVDETAGIPE
jgi:SPP1 family phage portal protein